jgi:hypothetical protein
VEDRVIWLLVSAAWAQSCEEIGFADVVNVPAPAVIVLGERHGTQPDLARATRVVRTLAKQGNVTLALEAVHQKFQPALDEYGDGKLEPAELREKLDWDNSWGFPWEPYERLVTAAVYGVKVVAAGPTLGPPPADAPEFPIPAGYYGILSDAMAGHEVPVERQSDFVRSMAWRDFSIADAGLDAWDGQGYLVIVTGRGHVEGGKGTTWQADQRVEAPVHGFVLAWGEDPPCYAGDKVWKKGPFG